MTPQQKIASLEARIANIQARLAGQTKVASGEEAHIAEIHKILATSKELLKEATAFVYKYQPFLNNTVRTLANMTKFSTQVEAKYDVKTVTGENLFEMATDDLDAFIAGNRTSSKSQFQYGKDLALGVAIKEELYGWTDSNNLTKNKYLPQIVAAYAYNGNPCIEILQMLVDACEDILKDIDGISM